MSDTDVRKFVESILTDPTKEGIADRRTRAFAVQAIEAYKVAEWNAAIEAALALSAEAWAKTGVAAIHAKEIAELKR